MQNITVLNTAVLTKLNQEDKYNLIAVLNNATSSADAKHDQQY